MSAGGGGGDGPSTSSSERLPSFKGPRDLTLAAKAGTITGGTAGPARTNKRVFKPNIPPKRGETPVGSRSGESKEGSREDRGESSFSGGRGGRGGRGSGGRGGRGRKEFIQSESVFSEGVGDPNATRKSTVPSMRRAGGPGGGIGRPGRGGDGGMRSSSSVTQDTLNDLIKKEPVDRGSGGDVLPSEANSLFGDDGANGKGTEGGGDEQEDPNVPLILPLSCYIPEKFGPPKLVRRTVVAPAKLPAPPVVVGSVRIKAEKEDQLEVPPEPILPELPPLEPTSFPHFFADAPKEGSIFVMQLPDNLPVLQQPAADAASDKPGGAGSNNTKPGSSTSASKDTKSTHKPELAKDISSLPEGYIGKIQITASGKTIFVLGENQFEIEPGVAVGFRQELVSVDLQKQKLTNLGPVTNKFICIPDLEALFNGL